MVGGLLLIGPSDDRGDGPSDDSWPQPARLPHRRSSARIRSGCHQDPATLARPRHELVSTPLRGLASTRSERSRVQTSPEAFRVDPSPRRPRATGEILGDVPGDGRGQLCLTSGQSHGRGQLCRGWTRRTAAYSPAHHMSVDIRSIRRTGLTATNPGDSTLAGRGYLPIRCLVDLSVGLPAEGVS